MITDAFYGKHSAAAISALRRENRSKAIERLMENGLVEAEAGELVDRAMQEIERENRQIGLGTAVVGVLAMVIVLAIAAFTGRIFFVILVIGFLASIAGVVTMMKPSRYRIITSFGDGDE